MQFCSDFIKTIYKISICVKNMLTFQVFFKRKIIKEKRGTVKIIKECIKRDHKMS